MLQSGEEKLRHAHYLMTVSNLRLAHHIATKYRSSGLPLTDLVQEANIGLLKAVDRFDYHRGFRFSTFATWWIRQSVTRAIADKSRSIRIPVHVVESLAKVKRAINELEAMGDWTATPEDIAEIAELPLEKVLKILDLPEEPLSIDALEEETPGFVETLLEREYADPELETLESNCSETIARVLATLTQKEERIIRMRFGIGEEKDHTLEEIGQCFSVTRERIRQIEVKVLKKLRHPSRIKMLKALVL
jgi:RNA polymerase primary sigma factor